MNIYTVKDTHTTAEEEEEGNIELSWKEHETLVCLSLERTQVWDPGTDSVPKRNHFFWVPPGCLLSS